MKYQHKLVDKVVVISIDEDELYSTDSVEIVETVKSEIQKGNIAFVIDLRKVKYINSTGINVLISVLTVIRNQEGELVLASLSEKIKSLLIITKLNSIFNVRNSVDESIEFLKISTKVNLNN